MPVIRQSIEMPVPPEPVFDLICRVEDFADYSDLIDEVRALGDDTYRWTIGVGRLRLDWDSRVVARERPRHFAWRSIRGVDNAGRFTLRHTACGTRVELVLEYRFPSRLVERLIAPAAERLASQVGAEVLDRVKARLEEGATLAR